jgi:hypothetical protein
MAPVYQFPAPAERAVSIALPAARAPDCRRTLEYEHAPRITVDFVHDQVPPAEWLAQLRDVSPESTAHGFLDLVWESGDPWAAGQRWALYEYILPEFADIDILAELRGPHPRSSGHICTSVPLSAWATKPPASYRPCLCREKTEAWRKGPAYLITLTQYRIFHRTGYVARPFWYIQGAKGGHKAFFTQEEERMMLEAGLPSDPPGVGELAYAPFDQRVLRQIVRHNRLQQVAGDLRVYRKQMGPDYAKTRATAEREMRKQLVDWLADGFLGEDEDLYRRMAADDDITDEMPRTEFDIERVEDEILETYIETGRAPDPATLHRQKFGC